MGNTINFDNGLVKTKKGWRLADLSCCLYGRGLFRFGAQKKDSFMLSFVRQSGKRDSSPHSRAVSRELLFTPPNPLKGGHYWGRSW